MMTRRAGNPVRSLFLLWAVGLWGSQGHESNDLMVQINGGKFTMGTNAADSKDGEGPTKQVTVKPFAIDKYPVTNKDFREFVRATKYKSEAEMFGWSFVFEDFVSDELKKKVSQKLESAPWWLPIERAFWRQPTGPGSGIKEKLDFPVLQGKFPTQDTASDGYHGVSPVDAYPAQNAYGLFDMLGNTWEWTSTEYLSLGQTHRQGRQKMYVLRGASWIDTEDGTANHKARVTTRMGNTADSASDNLSFRCAISQPAKHRKDDL
ncbi:inactive C-alpha-formylglycine-generating enzyme 2 isoform 2-T2 [Leptodactylus fuscus]|uniref:inactive C-alpha-formylglycine-generating enzyme 2 isoform X2 n=1 Tax=Leptodactylus fuscus TaxID=238119 RepID=UPI003F4ED41F